MVHFHKYEGAGNDFIIIDDRNRSFDSMNHTLIRRMCDRHFGIGADGLILMRTTEDHLPEMLYYNSDGFPGSLCGNGGRCFSAFARSLGFFSSKNEFLSSDGKHAVKFNEEEKISLEFHPPRILSSSADVYVLDTGSPHYVTWVNELSLDVVAEGRRIRNSEAFREKGINVNFIKTEEELLLIKTYERGVEDETLACGTGIVAAAIASHHSGRIQRSPVSVRAKGGLLQVSFEKDAGSYKNIWLTGPAKKVFEGDYPC